MKEYYQKTSEEVLQELNVNEKGITSEYAAKMLEQYGKNMIAEGKKKSLMRVFLEQFCDLLVIILIIAAVISMFSGNTESTIVIIAVIVLNAILGTVQHQKAEKSLESLKKLSSPNAKVIRDGQKKEVPAEDVVPGDILILEAGDLTAADGRILHCYSLQTNESSLTGETTNVEKTDGVIEEEVGLADRTNMVFSGSLITYGRAEVVITATGMQTEIGKIAALMNATKEKKTPLQQSLDEFSAKLAVVIMIISGIVFLLGVYRSMPILDAMMFAVALAVAAIPEALSSIVMIVQAMGTQKMARENAIVKQLQAVESLGCVSVICSDKTGTLTQNKMTVQNIYIGGAVLQPEELDLRKQLHRYLLYDAILANDSSIVDGKGVGDPTEYALLEMARKANVREDMLRDMMPRLEEIPFDSERKLMSTKYLLHGQDTILTKGAVDMLLPKCKKVREENQIVDMTEEWRERILAQNLEFSKQGLRVLAFAYREVEKYDTLSLDDEEEFIFIGLVSMMDPPREESAKAVEEAKRAGIRPVMITGDHKITASAIAKKIGIFEDGDMALTGAELDAMSEEELEEKIENISVYARVSPENKIRIVNAWQKKGNIVAMTGDGVNDAPALKKADIGVAMGITGTEVSKDAAAMILADDNFATIIKAVENGRNVYRNIKNAIQFLLSGNMAAILAVLYTSLAALPVPFAPVHLLFINLLTDSLPAIAIGMEPPEHDLLSVKPRDPKEGILNKKFMSVLFVQGAIIAIVTMISYYTGLNADGAKLASTMAFTTLTLARLFHGFNCRSEHSIFKIGFRRNWYSAGAFGVGIVLLILVIAIPPLARMFEIAAMSINQIGFVCLMAIIPTICIQLWKISIGNRK